MFLTPEGQTKVLFAPQGLGDGSIQISATRLWGETFLLQGKILLMPKSEEEEKVWESIVSGMEGVHLRYHPSGGVQILFDRDGVSVPEFVPDVVPVLVAKASMSQGIGCTVAEDLGGIVREAPRANSRWFLNDGRIGYAVIALSNGERTIRRIQGFFEGRGKNRVFRTISESVPSPEGAKVNLRLEKAIQFAISEAKEEGVFAPTKTRESKTPFFNPHDGLHGGKRKGGRKFYGSRKDSRR